MSERVLIPLDGSSHSEAALEYALENLTDPDITLVHVVDPVSVWEYSDLDEVDFDGYRKEEERRRTKAETLLNEYTTTISEHGLSAETVIKQGTPAKQILEVVEERDIDHIVMGSRGRSGVRRVLLGSVAETVTRRATVPVTVVR